jgi:hypothetical protein
MSAHDQIDAVPAPPPAVLLTQMATGYMVSQAIYVAAKLHIADHLSREPKTAAELAVDVGAHPGALHRLLRMLATLGVFRQEVGGRFTQSALSALLQVNYAGSLREAIILWNEEQYRAWGAALHSVKTGTAAFDHVFGMPLFPYLERNPEAEQVFNAAMTAWTTQTAAAVAGTYDFSTLKRLVDVGGGHATMMTSILARFAELEGVIFDGPSVVLGAREAIEIAGLTPRCDVVGGDFFEAVPSRGDGYLLSQVLHDWDDERCGVILRNCHAAMNKGDRLLVVETMLTSEGEAPFAALSDLHMLVVAGGRERTEDEYRALLARAGFEVTRVTATGAPQSLIEAHRS